ncbi:MAG TPA: beta-methylgalactoside transporter [Feifaniaceae bacterium]|nr:beta-methylgalactoside transporter [Feifaniaceae bacterium]
MDPSFLSLTSLSIILGQSASKLIFALGVAGIIIMGGVDLSVGRVVGVAGVLSASMLQDPEYFSVVFPGLNLPLIVPVALAMAVTALISFLQGTMVAKMKVPSFIASLGTSQIVYGLCCVYYDKFAGSAPIGGLRPDFTNISQQGLVIGSLKISYLFLIAMGCAFLVWLVWNKTAIGKNMYAIGGNVNAARVSGVNVNRNMLIMYVFAGLLYGLGGSFEGARTGSASNVLGQSYELDAMAACVVGGVSMKGGVGTIAGVIIGVVILQVINYGLVFVRVSADIQYIAKGAIILFAVMADAKKRSMAD